MTKKRIMNKQNPNDMKQIELQTVYLLVAQASLKGLSADEKAKVVKSARALRPLAERIDRFKDDAQKRADSPQEASAIIQKELMSDLSDPLPQESLLPAELIAKLTEANEAWNAAQIMLVEDCLRQPDDNH